MSGIWRSLRTVKGLWSGCLWLSARGVVTPPEEPPPNDSEVSGTNFNFTSTTNISSTEATGSSFNFTG